MNPFLRMIMLFGLLEGVDSGVTGAAVVDAPPAEPVTPPSEPVTPPAEPVEPVEPAIVDPNDPMEALRAAMDAQLGKDEAETPATPPDPAAQAQIPPEFAQALQISDFVKEPAHVEQAIRAADEVWKVATGQAPVSGMLEGMRAENPEGYKRVIGDLIPYIEQVTGRAFTDKPNTPPDPNQARMDKIEAKFAAEEQARQTQQWNQQVTAARGKALEFVQSKAKGTPFEGLDDTLLSLAGSKVGVTQEQMVQALLSGKTETLDAAYRAATTELSGLVKKINANLIKQHRTLANAVPAVKGGNGARPANNSMKPLPGETTAQTVARLIKG